MCLEQSSIRGVSNLIWYGMEYAPLLPSVNVPHVGPPQPVPASATQHTDQNIVMLRHSIFASSVLLFHKHLINT
jgi:hypothetical protein